ncbi:MAG: electron transport complex, RnfABCDGE type, subunit [Clostridiales bacterium]|jgi:electron transport complex protein RnfC|nr:electron transport complex, RnfABCDGE type, subunit [Clostridiales bacterium]
MGITNTFKRGIHPKDFKEMSKNVSIDTYRPFGEIIIPMSQHLGGPAEPIVNKGDRVLVGQKIGELKGFVSASVHSSVSGTVKEIKNVILANGTNSNAVVITNDNLYEKVESMNHENILENLTVTEIREKIKEAGIVGLGGAGFPTHIKLTPPADTKIDYIIVNGSECEPYLTSDYRIMLEEPNLLISGINIILKLFPEAKCIIAIENNKKEAIELLNNIVGNDPRISVKGLKTKYPQGAEKQLVYATTGRSFTSQKLPLNVGCIVQNIDTVVAIHKAILTNEPLLTRVVTITGDAITTPKNLRVRIGTNLNELIEAADGFKNGKTPEKIISGGPMMGKALFTTDVPITKGTSAFVFMSKDEVAESKPTNCIRCGGCVTVCPNGLLPLYLAKASIEGDEEEFIKLNGMECCECGCCSYTCPSKIHLAHAISSMRRDILAKRKK